CSRSSSGNTSKKPVKTARTASSNRHGDHLIHHHGIRSRHDDHSRDAVVQPSPIWSAPDSEEDRRAGHERRRWIAKVPGPDLLHLSSLLAHQLLINRQKRCHEPGLESGNADAYQRTENRSLPARPPPTVEIDDPNADHRLTERPTGQ